MSILSIIGMLMMIPGVIFLGFIGICLLAHYIQLWANVLYGVTSEDEKGSMFFIHIVALTLAGMTIIMLEHENTKIKNTTNVAPITTEVEAR